MKKIFEPVKFTGFTEPTEHMETKKVTHYVIQISGVGEQINALKRKARKPDSEEYLLLHNPFLKKDGLYLFTTTGNFPEYLLRKISREYTGLEFDGVCVITNGSKSY